ncbi:MAG: sugar transferase [Eubacterium sp.]|nr:sugar transferase [Eubacterium sp.]MBR0412677.1 sugar transferase [Eubacterium sp.]
MPYLEYGKIDDATEKRLKEIVENKSFKTYWLKKRIFDIIVSTILLIFAIIPILLVALAIFIDDPHGNPFYKQIRIGRHGEEFYMYKFRTMYVDADKRKAELMEQNEMDGPVFKIKDDPRITRLGKILRKISVDELPQFFNVLKGDMSMVGPRPPLPNEVAEYEDYHKLRLIVTPGITCDWQIADNRNDIPFEQWVEMDLNYIENRTTWGDLKIIFKTPFAMLSATGR